jgi:hypothetical protein
MRTTLTLDDDVARMLEMLQKEEKKSFKQLVNEILRMGIMQKKSTDPKKPQYVTPELQAGTCKYPDLDNIADILAVAEEESYS